MALAKEILSESELFAQMLLDHQTGGNGFFTGRLHTNRPQKGKGGLAFLGKFLGRTIGKNIGKIFRPFVKRGIKKSVKRLRQAATKKIKEKINKETVKKLTKNLGGKIKKQLTKENAKILSKKVGKKASQIALEGVSDSALGMLRGQSFKKSVANAANKQKHNLLKNIEKEKKKFIEKSLKSIQKGGIRKIKKNKSKADKLATLLCK